MSSMSESDVWVVRALEGAFFVFLFLLVVDYVVFPSFPLSFIESWFGLEVFFDDFSLIMLLFGCLLTGFDFFLMYLLKNEKIMRRFPDFFRKAYVVALSISPLIYSLMLDLLVWIGAMYSYPKILFLILGVIMYYYAKYL